MDRRNIRNIERITGHRAGDKIYLLLEFAGEAEEIQDPWYSGKFEESYENIERGCKALLKLIEEKREKRKT